MRLKTETLPMTLMKMNLNQSSLPLRLKTSKDLLKMSYRALIQIFLIGLILTPASTLNISPASPSSTSIPILSDSKSSHTVSGRPIVHISTSPQDSKYSYKEKSPIFIKMKPNILSTSEAERNAKKIQMAQTPLLRLNRMSTSSRTNSRFLNKFPPLEYLEFARRDGPMEIPKYKQNQHQHQSMSMPFLGSTLTSEESFFNEIDEQQYDDPMLTNQLDNSPIFYIKLPPAPYVLVPGLGYVSPHPYAQNNAGGGGPGPAGGFGGFGASPMMMSPLGSLDLPPEQLSSSASNYNNNVISLPLKFISNARPAQIFGGNGIHQGGGHNGKHTTLLSGGKYSFNGRPNGVFIVRSPAAKASASAASASRILHPISFG